MLEDPGANRKGNPGKEEEEEEISALYFNFRMNFVRNVTYETMLMTGLWRVVLERRTEGISSALTVVANVYIVFNTSFYFFLLLVYLLYTQGKKNKATTMSTSNPSSSSSSSYHGEYALFGPDESISWLIITTGLLLLLGFEIFASYNYFTAPLLQKNAQLYTEILLPALAVIFILVIDASLYMVRLYIKFSLQSVIKEHIKSSDNSISSSSSSSSKRRRKSDDGGTSAHRIEQHVGTKPKNRSHSSRLLTL